MSLGRRITLVSAAAVAIAVVLSSALIYVLTSNQLYHQIDTQLHTRADSLKFVARSPRDVRAHRLLEQLIKGRASDQDLSPSGTPGQSGPPLRNLQARPGQVRGYQQLIDRRGQVLFRSSANITLPVNARTLELAAGSGTRFFHDANVDGIHLRILAERVASERVVQLAQPLNEVDQLLGRLRLILVLVDAGGIALAALLGGLVAGAAVLPVKRLTRAAEHVAKTQDLSQRIAAGGHDEIGRLATSFNAMLDALQRSMAALDASVHAQRQLVADASHELRTPVTSLRTNIEILQQAEDMDSDERTRLLNDVVEQIGELTMLMNDLIDLARGEQPSADIEDVRLDLLVGEVVERSRKHAPATPLREELEPAILTGMPARLQRAVSNLIDNAVKYSPPGEPVEIVLRGGELSVRDHGPGISPEDLPHIFDRFYRGAEARGRPGSGLGLAIVRQVANQHGGGVVAEPAVGGGMLMRLRLPNVEIVDTRHAEPEGSSADYSTVSATGA